MPAKLTVIRGPNPDKVFTITQQATLGRSTKCEIPVDDGRASRNHCTILASNGEWLIRDLSSMNGTFVNRDKIVEQKLNSGDLIRIGATVYRFTFGDELPASPSAPEPAAETEAPAAEEPFNLRLDLLVERETESPHREHRTCCQCGRAIAGDTVENATEIGGRLYCPRCVVQHAEPINEPDVVEQDKKAESESSDYGSLLETLRHVTGSSASAPAPKSTPPAPEQKASLIDRLLGKSSKGKGSG